MKPISTFVSVEEKLFTFEEVSQAKEIAEEDKANLLRVKQAFGSQDNTEITEPIDTSASSPKVWVE